MFSSSSGSDKSKDSGISSNSDESQGDQECHSARSVAKKVAAILKLTAEETDQLEQAVKCMAVDDPLLVIKVDQAWVAAHGQQLVDDILDTIAHFPAAVGAGVRRDSQPYGVHRLVFSFRYEQTINDCRDFIQTNPGFVAAHVVGPQARAQVLNQLVAAGVPAAQATILVGVLNTMPMGDTHIITKVTDTSSTVHSYNFFYTQ